MLNRVEKLLKTCRMESLAYFVRPPVLDMNTKVSQKLIGTDEEEMVMIKQRVSPSCTTHIQLLNSQSIVDISQNESRLKQLLKFVGFTKKQAESQLVANKLKINE